jgi:alpha-glucosidase
VAGEGGPGPTSPRRGPRLRVPRGVDLLTGQEVAGEVEARYLLLEPVS